MRWHTAGGLAAGFASLVLLGSCAAAATPSPTPAPPSPEQARTAPPTMTPVPSPSPSAAATGRIAYPRDGFAITLADGWHRNDDPGEGFYFSGGVLAGEDGLGSRIGVSRYPLSMFDVNPAQAADPIGAMVEALTQGMPGGQPFSPVLVDPTVPTASPTDLPGSTTRSEVNLPAGPAVRLDGVVAGGPHTTVWLLKGGLVGSGERCEVQGAIHVVIAGFADPVAPSVIEQMARSLELLPHEAVLNAVGCVPSP